MKKATPIFLSIERFFFQTKSVDIGILVHLTAGGHWLTRCDQVRALTIRSLFCHQEVPNQPLVAPHPLFCWTSLAFSHLRKPNITRTWRLCRAQQPATAASPHGYHPRSGHLIPHMDDHTSHLVGGLASAPVSLEHSPCRPPDCWFEM